MTDATETPHWFGKSHFNCLKQEWVLLGGHPVGYTLLKLEKKESEGSIFSTSSSQKENEE